MCGCVLILAIVNKAAMDSHTQMFWWTFVVFRLGAYVRLELSHRTAVYLVSVNSAEQFTNSE